MINKTTNIKICTSAKLFSMTRIVAILLVLIFAKTISVSAQENAIKTITVTGNIKDPNNEPVIGATVKIENGTTGTVSDINGNFSLKAPINSNLLISYVGYTSQKVKATTIPISISLQEDAAKLDEVVVVGYGQVKRANLTGAVSSLAMKEVADIPAPNLASVIAGTMPGVHVSEPTGNPLGNSTISIRINGSFASTGDPLYVIDGFIRDVDAFNRIDPSEIESISVLKDASASVYGVRGSNGVVLIATKKGKVGKPKVSYSASYGSNQGINMPKMMTAYEQGVALNDLWTQNTLYAHSTTNYNYFSEGELEKLKTIDYNWIEQGWKNSNNTRHTLNVSGGSSDVRYFIGASYMYADGNFSNLNVNRYSIKFGVDADITKNLKGNFSMDYAQKDANQPLNALDSEADRMYGTFSELVRTPRFYPAYINGMAVNTGAGINALEMLQSGSYRKNNTTDISTGISLEYSFPQIKGLKATMSANYSRTSGYGKQLSKPYYIYSFVRENDFPHLFASTPLDISDANYRKEIENGDKIYESAAFGYAYQLNPQISYATKIGKHELNTMIMFEQSESGGNGLNESRQYVVIPNYEVMAGYQTTNQTTASNINTLTRRQSYIGRLNYNYADKYFLESAARYDASTNFAPGYRWGLFPSVSVGWRVSEETFFKDHVKFMNNLKLRASAGQLGNDRTAANQWRANYETNGYTLIGTEGLMTNLRPRNSGLVYYIASWETSNIYNGGIDMTFFNQLSLNIDGFFKHTYDILNAPKSIFPQSTGIGDDIVPSVNYGIQDAWGGEIELSYNKKINKDLSFKVSGNFAYSMNKVIKKYQSPGAIGTWKDENGKVAGGEVGYYCMGLARTQQDVDNYISYLKQNYIAYHGVLDESKILVMGLPISDLRPGMLMYKDVGSASYPDSDGNWHDGAPDGIINQDGDERIISKYAFNPFNYGLTLGSTWKNLSVSVMFTGAFGSNVIFEKGFWTAASGGGRTGAFLSENSNLLQEWYGNYWTENNTNAIYPRLDANSLRGYRSTFWMRNGHELHLKNINVSYTLTSKGLKKVGIDYCRVFFQGTNILTIINPYPYKDASVGFWSDYPMIRTVNLGLNLSF